MQKKQQNQSTNIKQQDLFVQIQSQFIDSIIMSEPHSNYIQPKIGAYHYQLHQIKQTVSTQIKNESSQLKQEQNLFNNDTINQDKVKTDRKDKKSCMPACLKKICQQLLSSQIQFISSLTCISGQLKACIKYLKQQNILPQQICDQLFSSEQQGSNWHNMQQISKNFSKKFSNFLKNGQHSSLLQKLQGIQSLQIVYKQQYTRIGKILQIISYIEDTIKKYLLQVVQKKQADKNNKNKQTNTYYKQILNHRTSMNRIVQSQIVDDQYIDTKFKSTYKMPKKKQEHPFFYNKTIQQQRQYIKTPTNYLKCKNLIEICIKIKKTIFKPLNKLKQFIHLITRYTHIQMYSYQSIIKQYKENNKTILHDATQYNNFLQQLGQIKKTVIKISAILQNIFGNQYQQMDEYQSTIKQLFYKYPELFCTQQQTENQETTPLIIPINTLQIYYMGIPCQLYLINNYLIIIKSHKQNITPVTGSRIKSKKNKEVIKLAIVEIDHSTQVQIVSHHMLYEQYVVYVSGGLKSSGVFLQFRASDIDQEDIKIHKKKCKQYIKQNNIELSQFKCPICSLFGDPSSKPFHPDSTILQLKKSTITSNIQILKTILQLNISYNSFIYYSRLHNINVYTCHKISYWKLDLKKYENQSEINVIYNNEQDNKKILQKQFITGFHYNLEEQTIPNTHLLSMRVLAIKYCYLDEQNTQKKYYIIELQVYLYDHLILCSPHQSCKNQCKNYHSNYSCKTQIVNMSQDKFYQLEQFIFRYYPNLLAVNRISKDQQYLDIMRFQQSRQLFLSSTLPNQNVQQKQSMMITELFNTLFKSTQFRNRPQQLLYRLGISEGMWKILVQGVPMNANEYYKFNGKMFKKIQLWCQCEQCKNVPQIQKYEEEYQRLGLRKRSISKFWRYHNHVSLYPYSSNYEVSYQHQIKKQQYIQKQHPKQKIESQFIQPLIKKQKWLRQTGCPVFMYRLQKNYINELILQNTRQKTEKNKEIMMMSNKKQKFCYEILDYYNRVKYIKYLSANYTLNNNNQPIHKNQCGLLNTITQSSKVRSLNILLYCLPSLNDYYHQLQKTEEKQINTKIFEQISQQNIQIGIVQNHGFTQKLLINIHKDTNCKHLKYIIAQRLQFCQDYISHFMQNFILVLVKKQQVKKMRSYFSWFKTNKNKNSTEYCINQMNVLQDHEKVYDILDFIKNYQDKYFISIKKNIKTQPILFHQLKINQKQLIINQTKPQQKLIKTYIKLLQLQLAQACYKINHEQLLIDQCNSTLIKYIVMLLSYLHIKLKDRKQRFTQKYGYELNQRLLIKTGVISKSVFELYYNNQLEQPDPNNKQTYNKIISQNLKIKESRRKHLQIIYKAQIQAEQNHIQIMNKLMILIYNKTNWNLTIQPILYINNTQNKQQLINCHIFVNEDGIVINNIRASKENFLNVNTSMLKSKLMKSKVDDVTLLDFEYSQIDVEIYGTVLTLVTKKALFDENKQLLQKYNLFSSHPYYMWQLIKYYKILSERSKDINEIECKIKQDTKEKQRRKSTNIQKYCRNFVKRTMDPSRKEQEQKAYSKLSAQFRRTDIYNVNSGLSDRTQSS